MSTKKLSKEEFLNRSLSYSSSKNYNFTDTEYVNVRTNIEIECKLHGKFICKPSMIMNGKGCKICDRKNGNNLKSRLTLDQYKMVASELHDNKYDYSYIDLKRDKIRIICPVHGEFLIRKSAHIAPTQLYGCQKCGNIRSIGEEKIIEYLELHNIPYEYQKTFEWCKSIDRQQPLRYDFYVPDLNILIEFDGRHHFEPTRYGGQTLESAEFQTKRTKFYDTIKTINAMLSGIKLIRIPYFDRGNISMILDNELII